jgi:hypothetical protein
MARNSRKGRNNNPQGRNQYSSDWMDTVRERPVASAAAAAAAVGAGVFLWSKRNQISDQIGRLSDQLSDWQSGDSTRDLSLTRGPNESSAIEASRATGARTSRSASSAARGRGAIGRAQPQSATM